MHRYIRSNPSRAWLSALAVVAIGVTAALSLPACQQGAQGDRCNPGLIETNAATSPSGAAYNADECNSGLTCTVPPTCVIAVCCPAQPPYTDPNCACLANPGAACACTVQELDGGPWVNEDAGGEDAGAVDAGAVDSGKVDAGGTDSGGGGDASEPIDAPSDAPTDAAG